VARSEFGWGNEMVSSEQPATAKHPDNERTNERTEERTNERTNEPTNAFIQFTVHSFIGSPIHSLTLAGQREH